MSELQVYTRQATDADMNLDLETILDQFEYQFTITHTGDWQNSVDLSAFGEIFETNYDTADAFVCSPTGGYPSVMFVVIEEDED